MPDEIRPIPLDHFTSSFDKMGKLNESISEVLNKLDPNEPLAVIGIKTTRVAELALMARIGKEFSFVGFLKHEPSTPLDYGVAFKWSPTWHK